MYWESLPEDVLGVVTQGRTECHYPKTYWDSLPEDVLGVITRRHSGSHYLKTYFYKTLDDKLGYPLMIISIDEHLTHSVPRELVYFPIVVEPLQEDILGVTTLTHTGSYYPKTYWELLPEDVLGVIRRTRSQYPKTYRESLPEDALSYKDLLGALMGKIIDINALSNFYSLLENEGFDKGRIYWVPVKELDVWALDFNNYLSDNDTDKELPNDEILYQGKSKDAKTPSVDPFGIYYILNKKPNNSENKIDDPTFPSGFTPGDMADNHVGTKDDNIDKHMGDIQPNKEGRSGSKSGNNSILPSIGCSGGILCVWDPNMFIKDNVSISDSFVAIRGDFNKVRMKQERFGTVFNALGANAFNQFIDLTSLVDLPIKGYSFTWAHKSASKISKLDRFLVSEGNGTEFLVKERTGHLKHLQDINNRSSLDVAQKAKIRWSIEGNENSKYFHGILNKKRSQLAIRGVLIDGDWIDEPAKVKNEFLSHFTNRFSNPVSLKILLDSQMLHTLASEQVDDLERNVTSGEIKRAVWDCGTNKSSDPDGFSFDFIRRYWKIIDKDMVKEVEEFFDSSYFPPGCNALFSSLLFQAGRFSMAFDSVRRDFLDDTLVKFGFGSKWRGWIQGSLNSAKGSILVNGSPTPEFKFHKGIRIDNSLTLSHLFYVDDAVFIGKWDRSNLITNTNMLKCFFMVSGLKINIHKSKLMGIDVPHEEVISAANLIGCSTLSRPFNYLRVKVGCSSSRIKKKWVVVTIHASRRMYGLMIAP
nr:RNA-directed DNA polymerase, eukaryota [Tanacetum cinerariifolium]